MSDYSTLPYNDVQNPQYRFYKLYIDGVCQFDKFLNEIERNSNDKKLFNYIIRYMDAITDSVRLPYTKFRHIEDNDRSDIFEFKKDSLRVYVIRQKPNFFIVIGGYKGNQKKDLKNLKSRVKDFPKEYEI